jgi:hypothetical protein
LQLQNSNKTENPQKWTTLNMDPKYGPSKWTPNIVIFLQGLRAKLPGKAAGQGCWARLPGNAAGQGCRARLPGKAARQGFRARLPGKAVGQGCNMVQYAKSLVKMDSNAVF